MLGHYSHMRMQAKRDAIAKREPPNPATKEQQAELPSTENVHTAVHCWTRNPLRAVLGNSNRTELPGPMTLPIQQRIRGQIESAESYDNGGFILVSAGEDQMVGIWKSIRKGYGHDGA